MTLRWLPIAFAALLLSGIVSLATPRTAHACSFVGSQYERADVIVVGKITEFARAPELDGLPSISQVGALVVLSVTFEVDQYLKGSGPTTLVAYDAWSAYYGDADGPGGQFSETDVSGLYYGGDCGALNANPLGEYRVAGLFRTSDGILAMPGWGNFATAASADDPVIAQAIERSKQELGLPFPPGTGSAGFASGGDNAGPRAALLLLAMLAAAAGARRVVARDSR